jgi:hypothetical protein
MRKRPILLAATERKPRLQEDLLLSEGDQVGILKDLKEQTKNFTMADKIKISNDLGEPTDRADQRCC